MGRLYKKNPCLLLEKYYCTPCAIFGKETEQRTYDPVYKDKIRRGSGNYERTRISTENWVGDAVGDMRLQWKFGTCYPNKGGYAGTNITSDDEEIQHHKIMKL